MIATLGQHLFVLKVESTVDTCIECDHQRFPGVLKISIEEVLIALRLARRALH